MPSDCYRSFRFFSDIFKDIFRNPHNSFKIFSFIQILLDPCNSFRFLYILSSSSKLFEIFRDSLKFSKILSDSHRLPQIVPDSFKFLRAFLDSIRFLQIALDSFRIPQICANLLIPSDSFRCFQILSNSFWFRQIIFESLRFSQILRFTWIFLDSFRPPRFLQILLESLEIFHISASFKILRDPFKLFKMVSDFCRFFRIIPDIF